MKWEFKWLFLKVQLTNYPSTIYRRFISSSHELMASFFNHRVDLERVLESVFSAFALCHSHVCLWVLVLLKSIRSRGGRNSELGWDYHQYLGTLSSYCLSPFEDQGSRRALNVQEGNAGSIQTSQRAEVLEQRKGTHEDECPKLAYVVKAEERHINTVLIRREILGFSPLSKVPKMLLQDQSPAEPCDRRMRRK